MQVHREFAHVVFFRSRFPESHLTRMESVRNATSMNGGGPTGNLVCRLAERSWSNCARMRVAGASSSTHWFRSPAAKDSTYVLYTATHDLGLHCLAFTLDNGYLSEHARANIDRACRMLGIEHVYYCMDPVLMDRLFALFMRKTGDFCSVCMRAIGMATQRIADMYDIPFILHGSSAMTELVLSREMFEPGSIPYIRNVLRGEPIAAECDRLLYNVSMRRRIGNRLARMERGTRLRLCGSLKLPDYMEWNYDRIYNTIIEKMGWQAPPENREHIDCTIHPVTTYAHNRRFPGLEIRRLTMAALIMVGQLTRQEALKKLSEEEDKGCPEPIMQMLLQNLGMSKEEFDRYIDMGPRHLQFHPARR